MCSSDLGTSSVLTTVSAIDPIYVQFNLTEQQYLLWKEHEGKIQGNRLPIQMILADGKPYTRVGTATILGLEVDATTGTIPVRATFANPGNLLRPGQYALIRVPVFVSKGALLIPQRAVRDTQGLMQVGVIGPDDTVTLRTIQMGERVGTLWIVDKGLEPGERVIVEGLEKVKTGDKVAPTMVPAEPPTETAQPSTTPPPVTTGKTPAK